MPHTSSLFTLTSSFAPTLLHSSLLLLPSSGASLKDAGKKKFAIIRMALSPDAILPKGAAK